MYEGPYPFSEIETSRLRKELLSFHDHIVLLLDIHAHGQMILYPDSADDKVVRLRVKTNGLHLF